MSKALKNKVKLNDWVSVKDFGAVGDGTTDDTTAIQAAVNFAGAAFSSDWFSTATFANSRVVEFPSATYKISSKILVPRGVVLKGNNSTIQGNGFGVSDIDCFESAYYSGTTLTSNIGTTPETQRLQHTRIEGFRFVNFRKAINLFNFNEGCAVRDCSFFNVRQALIAERCFYAEFTNLMNRGSASSAADWCFEFKTFVNVESIRNVSCIDRVNGILISGGVNGQSLQMVNVENGTNGIRFTGEVNPINIDSCYFESLTGTAIDMTEASAKRSVTIDNNWFAQIGTAITGVQMLNGKIGSGNYFTNVTNKVVITDNLSTIKVQIPANRVTSGLPVIPPGYSFGKAVEVEMPYHVFDGGSGNSFVRQQYTNGLVSLPFSGEQGVQTSGVPFCTNSSSNPGGTPFDVRVDTKITFDNYVMCIFAVQISDNTGTYQIRGRSYGTTVFLDTASGKTCAVSNNGGFIRLTFSSFSHPTGVYSIEGIVRMV